MDSGRVSIKVDVAQAFMLDRRGLRVPVSFDIVKDGVKIPDCNRLKQRYVLSFKSIIFT